MTLIGLWHGAGWSYILWGFYHGVLLNIGAWWKRQNRTLPVWLGRLGLVLSVLLGWGLFMSPDASYLRYLFAQLVGFGGLGSLSGFIAILKDMATPAIILGVALAISGYSEAANLIEVGDARRIGTAIGWGMLAVFSLLFLQNDVQFLYVQF
jgi:D-alanyl-lipoteichoic acid acyltransferase DltB (MBOAT superfamily)